MSLEKFPSCLFVVVSLQIATDGSAVFSRRTRALNYLHLIHDETFPVLFRSSAAAGSSLAIALAGPSPAGLDAIGVRCKTSFRRRSQRGKDQRSPLSWRAAGPLVLLGAEEPGSNHRGESAPRTFRNRRGRAAASRSRGTALRKHSSRRFFRSHQPANNSIPLHFSRSSRGYGFRSLSLRRGPHRRVRSLLSHGNTTLAR